LYKLKRHVAAWCARLRWDYPLCRPAPNKHTYFTILQIVESAFCTSPTPFLVFCSLQIPRGI